MVPNKCSTKKPHSQHEKLSLGTNRVLVLDYCLSSRFPSIAKWPELAAHYWDEDKQTYCISRSPGDCLFAYRWRQPDRL